MAATNVATSGFRECEEALRNLPKATGKSVLRRVAKARLEPMRADAEASAPREQGDLVAAIVVSEKRTRRAKGSTSKYVGGGKFRASASTGISMAMGPSSGKGVLNYASFQEFGTAKQAPNPYMRPAWDANAQAVLEGIGDDLWEAISKAAAKRAKKLAKLGGI